ncbi:MAG: hypothetical protein KF708_24390 [Pirellulales bacterium]|nr:hypothetical protein [Pirellulales bacterium]
MKTSSRYLSTRQTHGLVKLGEAYCPGDETFPSFAELGCAEHVDEILACMPEADRRDLAMLLGVCSWMPRFVLSSAVRLLQWSPRMPTPLGAAMRFLHMGIRGLLLTLYYSGRAGAGYRGPTPYDVLGYEVSVYTADVDATETSRSAI